MNKIIVLGSLNMDLVMETSKIPSKGETVIGDNFFISPGGKGANQAVCCGKQNVPVYIIGCVGNDSYGEILLENLKKHNVNTNYIKKVENVSTGTAMIILSEKDNRIIVNPGANYKIDIYDVKYALDAIGEPNDVLLVQMEIPEDVVEYSLQYANKSFAS